MTTPVCCLGKSAARWKLACINAKQHKAEQHFLFDLSRKLSEQSKLRYIFCTDWQECTVSIILNRFVKRSSAGLERS
jgi:hypothetical protein